MPPSLRLVGTSRARTAPGRQQAGTGLAAESHIPGPPIAPRSAGSPAGLPDDGPVTAAAAQDTWESGRAPSRTLVLVLTILPAVAILVWTIAIFVLQHLQFAVRAPEWAVRVGGASAAARLFAALVLLLFPAEPASARLRWVGSALLVLGIGVLVFGYLGPVLLGTPDPNTAMYQSLAVWLASDALFAFGLLPARPPAFTWRRLALVVSAFSLLATVVTLDADDFPLLRLGVLPNSPAALAQEPLHGLSTWHWVLSAVLVVLAAAAALGAVRNALQGTVPLWLAPSMIIWVGAELHNSLWTSASGPIVTTGDLLRLAFAVAMVFGGVVELRRIATERTLLLATQREQADLLTELAIMKSDFTAMVAHELVTPLAAIRALAGILDDDSLPRDLRTRMVGGIEAQILALQSLAGDVQAIARLERTDFAVQLRPVSLTALLAEAEAFGRTLTGDHPLTVYRPGEAWVRADPERICQVLRNLLDNAAKYSLVGTPIELSAAREGGRVRIAVADRGQGIDDEDLPRIFEKFGRGRASMAHGTPGIGVGLYLSRRILRAHGSDIAVQTAPGVGSVFSFQLREVP